MTHRQDSADAEIVPIDEHSKSLFERVADYLTADEWIFTTNEEQRYFSMTIKLRDASARIIVDVVEDDGWAQALVYTLFSMYVPEHRRGAMCEAINRINFALRFGNLEMDHEDGQVRVRTVAYGSQNLSEQVFGGVLRSNINTADRYQGALLAVAFGNAQPETVRDMATRAEESTLQ